MLICLLNDSNLAPGRGGRQTGMNAQQVVLRGARSTGKLFLINAQPVPRVRALQSDEKRRERERRRRKRLKGKTGDL